MAPNTEYLELNYVAQTATGRGSNTSFIMENLNNGFFQITDGRVGITIGHYKPKVYTMPIDQWDAIYQAKISRGYLLTKTKKMEKKEVKKNSMTLNGESFAPLSDVEVNKIINRLLLFANQAIDTNYSLKVEDISDEMIEYGKKILEELAGYDNLSVADFNNKLKLLYTAIPRRIDNLSKHLAVTKSQMQNIVAEEWDLYDLMVSQVKGVNISSSSRTILDVYNLKWRSITAEEEKYIKTKLGSLSDRYIKAWAVNNNTTAEAFEKYCLQENLSEEHGIHHLFHGSRSEYFWSIITNGLTVNPSGVITNGKMFGNGTYFAPLAAKSDGYTSSTGSRWANGSNDSGFMGIFKVATGKQYNPPSSDSSLNWANLQKKCPGAHCTWAKGGMTGLRFDEVIVYQNCQSTIEYLVEIKAR